MPENIIQIDQNLLETRLDRLVAEKVAELLNAMLDAEADEIANAAKYERTGERKVFCFNVCSTGSAVFFRSVG